MINKSKKISSILFVTILEEETTPLVHLLKLNKISKNGISPFVIEYEGVYHEITLHLIQPIKDPKFQVDSIGPEISALITYIAIQNCKPDLVINLGSSGGVIKDNGNIKNLKIGDICVSDKGIIFYDRDGAIDIKKQGYFKGNYDVVFLKEMNQKLDLKEVQIGSSSSFGSDQSNAFKKGVDVGDMEAASIGKVCYWMDVPFMAVKVISDLDNGSDFEQKEIFEESLVRVSEKLARKIVEILEYFVLDLV